ncbi:MAG: MFS transporter [Chloroflexi bacterium]|nr:MFS transporter [Chloroflexota bacterium]
MRRSPATILAVIAFGVFVAADDLTVVSTMLRQIAFDLELVLPDQLDKVAWIVNVYLIAYVVVMPFIGRVSDIVGRRAVYMAALGLFLAGSIWVPLAPSYNWFLVGRILTALGGGAMVPVGMAIIADVYHSRERATAMGILGAIDTAGWVWGPLYGAVLVRWLTWQWQFYLNIPLSLLGLAAAWWALADLPQPQLTRRGIDWLGTALLTIFLLALNIALLGSGDVGAAGGFATAAETQATWSSLPFYVTAAIALALFLASQRRLANHPTTPPLLDLSLFRRLNFTPAVLVNFIVGAVLIVAMVNVPLVVNVLEGDVGQAALQSGYLLSGMTGAMAILAYVGGRATARASYRPVTAVGLLLCTLGLGLMGWTWDAAVGYGQMGWQLVILGMGFGLVIAPIGTAVINAAPPDQRGIASSLVIVMRLIGMSVGLAGLTAWGLERFNALRVTITLPDLTDPTYFTQLVEGLTRITVTVLAETFLISAGLAAVAFLISLRLQRDEEA